MPTISLRCADEQTAEPLDVLQRGLELHRLGMFEDAEQLYRDVLVQDPTSPQALHFLALLRMQQGDFFKALELIAGAVEYSPRSHAALATFCPTLQKLALEFKELRAHEAATITNEILLAIEPDNATSIADRCVALLNLERFAEALDAADRVLAIDPNNANGHLARGIVMQGLDRYEQAMECYEQSLALAPGDAEVHKRLGGVLQAIGRFDRAIYHCEQAIALGAIDDESLTNRSLVYLSLGRFNEGFEHYDSRLDPEKAVVRAYAQPRWDGAFTNKLLVWGEQGLGDQILYAGMLPEVAARAGSVVVEVEHRLVELFGRSFPDLNVCAIDKQLYAGEIDAHTPIGSLGRYLRTSWDAFPRRDAGYLVPDPARASALQARLKGDGRTVIGLSWKSQNPKFEKAKSARLLDFEAVLRMPNCRFVDLQYGDTSADREAVACELGVQVEHLDDIDNTHDIDGLAALMSACDMVVTVSNTTAHLAGAVGRPTVVFVPFGMARMWYWFRELDESPWYPRVSVKRQVSGQSWAEFIAAATPEIAAAIVA